MQLPADQISAHLRKGLAPVYLVSGDEPLLAQEVLDAIRAAARAAGFGEREIYTVESGFDWDGFYNATREGSLFAPRRLLDLRLPTGKPGEAGAAVLTQLAEEAAPDLVLIVSTGKLDKSARAAKWIGAIERAGVSVSLYPIEAAQLPAWVARRMRARGLAPAAGVAELLAHHTEGNLLACAQEIDKLALLGSRELSLDDIDADLSENARFNVFGLADACLAGERAQVLRILRSLAAEGAAPTLVLWALAREARDLSQLAAQLAAGRSESEVLDKVWMRRRPLVRRALKRMPVVDWRRLLVQAARVDRVIKGRADGEAWHELERLALAITGMQQLNPSYALVGAVESYR